MKTELREMLAHGGTISREEILARLEDRALVILNVMAKETFADRHIPDRSIFRSWMWRRGLGN